MCAGINKFNFSLREATKMSARMSYALTDMAPVFDVLGGTLEEMRVALEIPEDSVAGMAKLAGILAARDRSAGIMGDVLRGLVF
jgi:hypothetical protein